MPRRKAIRVAFSRTQIRNEALDAALKENSILRDRLDAINAALKRRRLFVFQHSDGTVSLNER